MKARILGRRDGAQLGYAAALVNLALQCEDEHWQWRRRHLDEAIDQIRATIDRADRRVVDAKTKGWADHAVV